MFIPYLYSPLFSRHQRFRNPWTWSGVECPSGKVIGLSLADNQLQGEIPRDALVGLKGLITLDLSVNEIEGLAYVYPPREGDGLFIGTTPLPLHAIGTTIPKATTVFQRLQTLIYVR